MLKKILLKKREKCREIWLLFKMLLDNVGLIVGGYFLFLLRGEEV